MPISSPAVQSKPKQDQMAKRIAESAECMVCVRAISDKTFDAQPIADGLLCENCYKYYGIKAKKHFGTHGKPVLKDFFKSVGILGKWAFHSEKDEGVTYFDNFDQLKEHYNEYYKNEKNFITFDEKMMYIHQCRNNNDWESNLQILYDETSGTQNFERSASQILNDHEKSFIVKDHEWIDEFGEWNDSSDDGSDVSSDYDESHICDNLNDRAIVCFALKLAVQAAEASHKNDSSSNQTKRRAAFYKRQLEAFVAKNPSAMMHGLGTEALGYIVKLDANPTDSVLENAKNLTSKIIAGSDSDTEIEDEESGSATGFFDGFFASKLKVALIVADSHAPGSKTPSENKKTLRDELKKDYDELINCTGEDEDFKSQCTEIAELIKNLEADFNDEKAISAINNALDKQSHAIKKTL